MPLTLAKRPPADKRWRGKPLTGPGRWWLVTDARRLARPRQVIVALARLPRGGGVIVRHPDPASLERLARCLAPATRRRGVRLWVAGDPRLAVRLARAAGGPVGLHLSAAAARRRPVAAFVRQKNLPVSAAAHGRRALDRARRAGATVALLGPVFATASHPGRAALGVIRFARLVRQSPLPVVALGGITRQNARRLRAMCGRRLAGFAAVGLFAGPAEGLGDAGH